MSDTEQYTAEELQSVLYDIMTECINGRTDGHRCPFCKEGTMACTVEEDVSVRMECPQCGKYFDARLG
jgi:hypothetical protein